MQILPFSFSGQKTTENYYARNHEPWDNPMFVCMGYDAETPSNSHLYVAAQERKKQKASGQGSVHIDTTSNDEDDDYVAEKQTKQCQDPFNSGASTEVADDDQHNNDDTHDDPGEDIYGHEALEDLDVFIDGANYEMLDLYDPCANDEGVGYGDITGAGGEGEEGGDGAGEIFCPWESGAAEDATECEEGAEGEGMEGDAQGGGGGDYGGGGGAMDAGTGGYDDKDNEEFGAGGMEDYGGGGYDDGGGAGDMPGDFEDTGGGGFGDDED